MKIPTSLAEIIGTQNVVTNLADGAFCRLNLFLAAVGAGTVITLEDHAKIFAALATGAWFTTQTALAILAAIRRRRTRG